MGLGDRLWKVATGFGGAIQAPFGYVKDLATAPWTDDDELDGFLNVVFGRMGDRAGQAIGNLIGPDEGLGAAIGALPERPIPGVPGSGLRSSTRQTFETLETAGREGIREPLSTLFTAGQLANTEDTPLGRVGAMFRGDTWQEAYGIAQDRSVGQAVTLGLLNTEDIRDTAEVNRVMGTDLFNVMSGTVDAIARVTLDADIVLAKAGTILKVAKFVKPITSAEKTAAAAFDTKVGKVLDDIHDNQLSPAQIRDRYFAKHDHGAPIADVLAKSSGDREELTLAFQALVGDYDAIGRLAERRADLAGELSRLVGPQESANRLTRAGFELPRNLRDELDGQLLTETKFRYEDELQRLDRILGVHVEDVTVVPGTAGAVRDLSFASHVIQNAPGAPAVRNVFRMKAQPWINFEDVASDIQITRVLQKAPVPADVADELRSAYISQLSPGGRRQVFDKVLDTAVEAYGKRAGMDGDELIELVRKARASRGEAMEELSRSRSYDAQGRGVFEITDDAGHVTRTAVPVWMSQESNFGTIPDFDLLDKAAKNIARHNKRYDKLPDWVPGKGVTSRTALGSPAAAIPGELGDMFNRVWKPSVLIRPGWPMRVVSDEQLRIMAKIGVLTQMTGLARAAGRWTVDAIDALPSVVTRKKTWAEAKDSFGLRWHDVNGYRMQAARGTPEDGRNVHQQLVAQTSNLNARLFGVEAEYMNEFRKGVADHRTFLPTDSGYGSRWAQALNKQAAGDAVGRRLLQGDTVEDVVRWLRADEVGRAYLTRDPLWAAARAKGMTLEDTIALKKGQLDDLTLGQEEIAQKALAGEATIADLRRLEPDAGRWMPVHGQVVADAFGGSFLTKMANETVSKAYRALGGMPSTVLSRNRYFDHVYRSEIDRLTRLAPAGALSDDQLRLIERQARDHALSEVKRWLFDVSETSDLAERLRFISPFFMAQQEILTRWAGLAAQNPAFVLNMRKVWQSPEKAGIVVDENGNKVDGNGQATVPLTGEKVEAGEGRYVILPIPEWAEDIPGAKALGRARFNKEALNVALQLNAGVGTGPLVQIPVNEIVKNRPDLAASVDFILPYGTSQDTFDLMLPATAKRIRTSVAQESSEEYRNSVLRLYYDMVTDYNLGKRDDKPTYVEAKKRADEFWSLRTVASWVSPAAPWFTSPYQAHIDAYRNAENKYRKAAEAGGEENLSLADADGNARTPDEWFIDEFGEEYFALTQHVTRTVDGVPPTVEGFLARKKYKGLIEEYPELGGLIVGAEGAGEFSRAVYEHQKAATVRPGSAETQRQGVPFEEAQTAPDVRLGWQKFSKMMDFIDAARVAQGLPNLQVKAAERLANLKRVYVQALAQQYPEWYSDYSDFDPSRKAAKLAGLRAIASDPQLRQRPEIAGLNDYFKLRDRFVTILAARKAQGGSASLTSTENQPLRSMWESAVGQLVEQSLAFGDLYHRWLESDLPQASDSTSFKEAA